MKLKRVVLLGALGAVVIGCIAGAFTIILGAMNRRIAESPKYFLRHLVQTGPAANAMESLFLEEVLDLSSDKPTHFVHFDEKAALEKLYATHVIEKASITKIKPSIVFIDYKIKEPIALVGDFSNTGMDSRGSLFPYYPYYSPKNLPEIWIGKKGLEIPHTVWGGKVGDERMRLLTALLEHLAFAHVLQIDLAQCDHESLGTREIVVMLRAGSDLHTLRLTPNRYPDELQRYIQLRRNYFKGRGGEWTIDLRLPELAFITQGAPQHA